MLRWAQVARWSKWAQRERDRERGRNRSAKRKEVGTHVADAAQGRAEMKRRHDEKVKRTD